jgi:aminopeptidase N
MLGPATIERTTSHEVAHQWFYALVGNDQARDPVLDEGLASYAELSHEGLLETAQTWAAPAEAVAQANRPMSFWEQHLDAYYLGVYVQGARALASLGPTDEVDCALRRYVAGQAFATATPEHLLAALSSVFPNAVALLVPYGVG